MSDTAIRPLAPGRLVNESGPDEAGVRRVFRHAGFETATVYQQGMLRSSFAIG